MFKKAVLILLIIVVMASYYHNHVDCCSTRFSILTKIALNVKTTGPILDVNHSSYKLTGNMTSDNEQIIIRIDVPHRSDALDPREACLALC